MNNKTIINTFNSDINNIIKIKTEHGQIIAAITNKILNLNP